MHKKVNNDVLTFTLASYTVASLNTEVNSGTLS